MYQVCFPVKKTKGVNTSPFRGTRPNTTSKKRGKAAHLQTEKWTSKLIKNTRKLFKENNSFPLKAPHKESY